MQKNNFDDITKNIIFLQQRESQRRSKERTNKCHLKKLASNRCKWMPSASGHSFIYCRPIFLFGQLPTIHLLWAMLEAICPTPFYLLLWKLSAIMPSKVPKVNSTKKVIYLKFISVFDCYTHQSRWSSLESEECLVPLAYS